MCLGLIPAYTAAVPFFPVARMAKPQRVCHKKNQTNTAQNNAKKTDKFSGDASML